MLVWALFLWGTLAPIIFAEETLTGHTYLNIVVDHTHPFMMTVFPGGDDVFQQDSAPCHAVKKVKKWFQEHDQEFTLLSWSSDSLDVNAINHLWFELEKWL